MECLPPTVIIYLRIINTYFTSSRLLTHSDTIIGVKQPQKQNVTTLNIAHHEKKTVQI